MAAAFSRLGPYEILGPLGAGGMGQVYRARDPRFRRDVAIKVLPDDFAAEPERIRRFEHEARAAGALNHPNILTVHDLGSEDGAPYLVTELLEGETLRELLTRGPVPVAKALDWATQIARGLAAAHEQGIVHRDLKPENLFITRDGRAKILDFGLARLGVGRAATGGTTLTLTEAGVTLGTVGYMSPEQVRGEPADHRSDLFSYGCVLYELLGGQRAFPGEVGVQVLSAILSEEPRPLTELKPEVPALLERLVRHCLEKDPVQRFQSARDLVFALETSGGAGVVASSGGSGLRPGPKRIRIALALVFVALVAGALGATLHQRLGQSDPPVFRRLTFRRGYVTEARYTRDGNTVVYAASWQGAPVEIYATSPGRPESRSLGLPGCDLLSVSPTGELAIRLPNGTLARVPLAGGTPRELIENVRGADWGPGGTDLAVIIPPGARAGNGTEQDSTWRLEYPIGSLLVRSATEMSRPRVSPDGRWVAFVDHSVPGDNGGSIAIVDRRGVKRSLTPWWVYIESLAWVPRRGEIWFSAFNQGEACHLRSVPMNGKSRVVMRSAGGLALKDIARNGTALVARFDFRSEVHAHVEGESRERDLSWFEQSLATDMSADGRNILLVEQGETASAEYITYARAIGGGPAVRLFDGLGTTLSPDGRWVLALGAERKPPLVLQPTGTGTPQPLDPGPIVTYDWASWFPDGRRIVCAGFESDGLSRCFVQDLSGGPPRPVTPARTNLYNPGAGVSPDGRHLLVRHQADETAWLYPLEGGTPRRVPGIGPGEFPMRWSPDGRYLYSFVARVGWIYRLDLSTGLRTLWKTPLPADSAGIRYIGPVLPSADGRTFVYTAIRALSDLYLVEGIR